MRLCVDGIDVLALSFDLLVLVLKLGLDYCIDVMVCVVDAVWWMQCGQRLLLARSAERGTDCRAIRLGMLYMLYRD